MQKYPEEAEEKFDLLLTSLIPVHPGKCLRYNALDGRYVVADDTQVAAKIWRKKYGELKAGESLEDGDYLEIISNTIPTL
jgi:hypothetical protein